jgi:hypothetical protein
MASILRVNTLTDASSNNSTAMSVVHQGTVKAWSRGSGVSTPAHADSTNMGSITDNGTGDYTFAFTSSFSSGNYCFGGSNGNGSKDDDVVCNRPVTTNAGNINFTCNFNTFGSADGHYDSPMLSTLILGDLA